ncbi:MAG TPA: methionine biosynthesis protein MetW [Candidatus Omnitrophota bacterium]|jgi:methionine biosynthesis protein MetW|nr:methionine biosynthesis protein MetW [Candidatus Omnitrophota bacterium]
MSPYKNKLDHKVIYDIIEAGAKVLDLGCGGGELLELLVRGKKIKAQGVELSNDAIHACVEKGLSVFHSDIDSGLPYYPDQDFDYVILNQSLQEVKQIETVIGEALRVGKKVIVGFPNFAYLQSRSILFFGGRAPVSPSLPYEWYRTPNLRFLSIKDFRNFCSQKHYTVLEVKYLGKKRVVKFFPNLFAANAIFVIAK